MTRFLSSLIVALTCRLIASDCDVIKCRYTQTNVRSESNSDPDHGLRVNNFPPSQYFINYSQKKVKSSNRNTVCLSFVSSTSIDRVDMDKMIDCASIDMSGNQIEAVERILFMNLQPLQSLNLDHNQLKTLPDNVFNDLVSLRKVSIAFNFLEVLSGELFKFNLKLTHIGLSNNKLKRISPTILDHLNKLTSATFHGNFCIDSSFPHLTLDELKTEILTRCAERNLVTLVISLMKISSRSANKTISFNETSKITDATEPTVANETVGTVASIDSGSEMDTLIVSLFWLIMPLIVILCAILAAIVFIIYHKYFVYSLQPPRNL